MPKKIVVIPNDPIYKYYKKGEIKSRYFNPCNFFDEVHVISMSDKEIEVEKVQSIAGKSKLRICPVGKFSLKVCLSFVQYRNKLLKIIDKIHPNVIRAYNPLIGGWLAVSIGKKLGIPTVVSLHGNDDKDHRELMLRGIKDFSLYNIMKYFILEKITEKYVLKNATKVICAYEFPVRYAKKYGAKQENIQVIYNRVYSSQFKSKAKKERKGKLTVINVGRFIKEKNQEGLIKAIKNLDVKLLLIGDGVLSKHYHQLVKDLKIWDKVKFIKSVPNSKIQEHYQQADIFATSIYYGGVCIPVIEAMATGLPIVTPKPLWEKKPELIGDSAIVVENSPKGFKKGLEKLISNPKLRKRLGMEGRKKFLEIEGKRMERKEMESYKKIIIHPAC